MRRNYACVVMAAPFIPRRQRLPVPVEGVHEGVPPGLKESLVGWLMPNFRRRTDGSVVRDPGALREVERILNIELGEYSFDSRLEVLVRMLKGDDEMLLFVTDHFLGKLSHRYNPSREIGRAHV